MTENSPVAYKWSTTAEGKEWDGFVESHGGSIFQSWAWRKILQQNGLKPRYSVCHDPTGGLVGVCPLVAAEGRRYTHLQTPPDSFTAGPLIEADQADVAGVLGALPKLPKFSPLKPVLAIHIRTHLESVAKPMIRLGFQNKIDEYGLLITDLGTHPLDLIWKNGFNKHDRQTVKYHEDIGCEFRLENRAEDFQGYIELKEGPTWNRSDRPEFFASMKENLGDRVRLGVVVQEDKVIAGSIFLCDAATSTVHLLSMKYTLVRNIHSPVTYLNLMTARWADGHGFRHVDFGPWSTEHAADAAWPAYKLKRRFEADLLPVYAFSIRPSGLAYSITRRMRSTVQKVT